MWKLAKNLSATIADLVIVKTRSVQVFLKKIKTRSGLWVGLVIQILQGFGFGNDKHSVGGARLHPYCEDSWREKENDKKNK